MTRKLIALIFMLTGLFGNMGLVMAGDEALYDAPPPPDSAFFRVLNADPEGKNVNVSLGDHQIKSAAKGISSYVIVKAGDQIVKGLNADVPVTLKAGAFYTLAVVGATGETKLFDDKVLNDPAKSRLFFYNMSDAKAVNLFVPAASKDALTGLEPSAANSVELKAPMELEFVAKTGDSSLATFSGVVLKRRATVSLVLFGAAGSYTGSVTPNTVDQLASN
jgi:Alginate O-acetyl transferase AlgF